MFILIFIYRKIELQKEKRKYISIVCVAMSPFEVRVVVVVVHQLGIVVPYYIVHIVRVAVRVTVLA